MRLKVAMLLRQFSPHGGLELYAHRLVEGLLENDLEVTVLCSKKESDLEHRHLNFQFIESENKAAGKAALLESLYAGANQAIARLKSVDLIHSQHCPSAGADLVTFHNHSLMRMQQVGLFWERLVNDGKRTLLKAYRLRERQDEIMLRRAHCLIFPAQVMKEDFFSAYPFLQGPPAKAYVIAHPGASFPGLEKTCGSSTQTELSADSFKFLFVGRGFRKKGLDILLSACARLKSKHGGKFKLLIAGLEEKPADRLRLLMLGIEQEVVYLGFQKDMDAVYAQAKVIILPSRLEPFGMAPVQGMQKGLVPIVSRVSGVSEILKDKYDSLILEDHLSAEQLCELMHKLMQDKSLLERLSANAIQTAARVSWQETVNETLKAYEIALKLKNSSKC